MGRFSEAPKNEQISIVQEGDCLTEAMLLSVIQDDVEFALVLSKKNVDVPLWLKLCFQCASVRVLNFLQDKMDWDLIEEWDFDIEIYVRLLLSEDINDELFSQIVKAVPSLTTAVQWLPEEIAQDLLNRIQAVKVM